MAGGKVVPVEKVASDTRDKQVWDLFREVITHCRNERKAKTSLSIRQLAKQLGKTENYLSSIENGREIPSLKLFLQYLLINGFDPSPLRQLSISKVIPAERAAVEQKMKLVEQIYSLDTDQVNFLAEQAKVAEIFRVKRKKKQ